MPRNLVENPDMTIEERRTKVEEIIRACCQEFGVKISDVTAQNGKRGNVTTARDFSILFLRQIIPVTTIANIMGGRDHNSLYGNITRIQSRIYANHKLEIRYNALRKQLAL